MLPTNVQACQESQLRELADRPNTEVYTVAHDSTHTAWAVSRLKPLFETLVARVTGFPDDTSDFTVRKTCLDDPEVLAFQRCHPRFYYMLTDRTLMREPKYRNTITALLELRSKVEAGEVPEGPEADAFATRTVMASLEAGEAAEAER